MRAILFENPFRKKMFLTGLVVFGSYTFFEIWNRVVVAWLDEHYTLVARIGIGFTGQLLGILLFALLLKRVTSIKLEHVEDRVNYVWGFITVVILVIVLALGLKPLLW